MYSRNQVFYNLLIFTSTGPFSVIKVAFRGSEVGLIVCIGDDGTVVLCNKVVWQFCERSLSFEFTSVDMLEVLKRLDPHNLRSTIFKDNPPGRPG